MDREAPGLAGSVDGILRGGVARSKASTHPRCPMYQPRFLSLHEAARAVAIHLASADPRLYSDEDVASDAACRQLVQALYDGAVGSEGEYWKPMPPVDDEMPPILPPERTPIDKRFWSNQQHPLRTEIDENRRHISRLDIVTVCWEGNFIEWNDKFEQNFYGEIHLVSADVQTELLKPFPVGSVELPDPRGRIHPKNGGAPETTSEVTLSTGAAGRPTSMHLVEIELQGRFAKAEQLASMSMEAEYLAGWLQRVHPAAARLTKKTIQNRLGAHYRQLARQSG